MNILKNFTAALLLAVPLFQADLTAQSDNLMKAILYLSGADSEEELDEQEMERFSVLASSPLANSANVPCFVFSIVHR